MSDIESLMKRCRAGTTNYEAANDLHASCYGALGKQEGEIERLKKVIQTAFDFMHKEQDDTAYEVLAGEIEGGG
jgi:hypothetical protein